MGNQPSTANGPLEVPFDAPRVLLPPYLSRAASSGGKKGADAPIADAQNDSDEEFVKVDDAAASIGAQLFVFG